VLGVTVRLMSDGELSRLEVLRDLDQKRLTRAARLLAPERRQMFRLSKVYRTESATGLISKRCGCSGKLRRVLHVEPATPGRRMRVPTVAPLCTSDELHDLDQKPIDHGGQQRSCCQVFRLLKAYRSKARRV